MDDALEFIRFKDGRCILMEGEDIIWSSDDDAAFQADFGETIDPDDIDNVLEYLADNDVLDDDAAVDITDEDDPEVETVADIRDDDELAGEFDDGDMLETLQ